MIQYRLNIRGIIALAILFCLVNETLAVKKKIDFVGEIETKPVDTEASPGVDGTKNVTISLNDDTHCTIEYESFPCKYNFYSTVC